MRFLAPSVDEIQTWGRRFGLYPGATATGSTDSSLAPLPDGGLSAAIPLQDADHARRMCEAAGLDPGSPEREIDAFQTFKLGLTGYKFETSFRGAVKWLTNCNLLFLEDDRVLSLISAEAYLGSSITSSIEEVGLLVDKVIVTESPFVPSGQAFDRVAI